MCGQFGYLLTKRPDPRIVAALGDENDLRGGDSWGFYTPSRGIVKRLGLIAEMGRNAFRDLTRSPVAIVHTRFATTGAVTKANAHPWRIGGLVGSHNGVISNHRELGGDFQVDSMHLIKAIANGAACAHLQGWGAAQWMWQHDPDIVYLCRFNGGEMAVKETADGYYWSSTQRSLDDSVEGLDVELDEGVIYALNLAYGVEPVGFLDVA